MPSSRGSSRPGMEPGSLTSPALTGGFFVTNATWEAPVTGLVFPELWMQVPTTWSLVSLPLEPKHNLNLGLNFLPLIITCDLQFEKDGAGSFSPARPPAPVHRVLFLFLLRLRMGWEEWAVGRLLCFDGCCLGMAVCS